MVVMVFEEAKWFQRNIIKKVNEFNQVSKLEEIVTIIYTVMELFLDVWFLVYIT